MRLFTALEFEPEVLDEIMRVQAVAKTRLDVRRWQSMRQAHLTVDFLGETPEALLDSIKAMLDAITAETAPFELSLGGFGAFPNMHRPKVLWLGVDGDVDRLAAMEARMREGLAALGMQPEDRAYRPHITLAREVHRTPALEALGAEVTVAPWAWTATELVLF